jgi:hypothetical protein
MDFIKVGGVKRQIQAFLVDKPLQRGLGQLIYIFGSKLPDHINFFTLWTLTDIYVFIEIIVSGNLIFDQN